MSQDIEIEKTLKEIKEFCGDCEKWSGTDCINNPYKDGCVKGKNDHKFERLTKRDFEDTECDPYVVGGVEFYGDSYGGKVIDRLAELEDKLENGLLVELPCKIGDTVYRLCKCEDIPTQLDGTMYDFDGSPGTATGYYCPYEGCCPFETEFDTVECNDVKNEIGIFEDIVCGIRIDDEESWVNFEYVPYAGITEFGKSVFLNKSDAEAELERRKSNE